MKSAFLVACVLLLPMTSQTSANEEGGGGDDGVYQRQRMHGGPQGYGGNFYGNPYHGGYFGGYYFQPPIYGSWYARPYPTHLDYFRLRSRTPPMTPRADCPRAEDPQTDS